MNTEKIEKLKKSLSNSKIPADLKPKIEAEIKRLEDLDAKQSEPKEEEKEVKPVAKKTTTRKPRTTKPVAKKTSTAKPSQTSKPKRTAMSVAKEIRKDGESWKDAMARASKTMKEKTKTATKDVETELQKLTKLVRGKKELKGQVGKTNLLIDAKRKAKPMGRRVSKDGNVYYENRANRTDRGTYGKYHLAEGGSVDNSIIDELWRGYASAILFTETDMDSGEPLDSEFSIYDFNKESEANSKKMLSQYYSKYKDAIEESELDLETVGMDIWYTQSGQGAGFFDHSIDQEVEDKLTKGAEEFGKFPSTETYRGKVIIRGGKSYAEGGYLTDPNFGNFQTGVFAKGGGVRTINGREYSYGRNWTNDHNLTNKGEEHEVNYTRKKLAKGGGIPNNYEEKTPEQVWNMWTEKQKQHFLVDHFNHFIVEEFKGKNLIDISRLEYKKLPLRVRLELDFHVNKGQYADGGLTDLTIQNVAFAKGGGVRTINGREYSYGRNWTNDHNLTNKGEEHEVNYTRKKLAKGGRVESLTKELYRLQRELNSSRLQTYRLGDNSQEAKDRKNEREVKLARFNEVLKELRESDAKFELGGVMVTDLAGHTGGGDGGLNAGMPLDGFSNTGYTGLVGETGAMSSGEMFMAGGKIQRPLYILHDSETKDTEPFKNLITLKEFEQKANELGYTTSIDRKMGWIAISKTPTGDDILIAQTLNPSKAMFMNGGGLPSGASQSYMITESLGNPAQHFAKGGGVGKMYYHILEYGDYGNIGYQGYYDTLEEAQKQVKKLSDYFPNQTFEIFADKSRKEPPITTMAKGGGVRKVGNREYSYGRNWTNDHEHTNKSEEHEVNYTRKGKFLGVFADGGGVGKWIGYDKDHLMNTESGMIVLRGTDLKNIKPEDIKGYDMLDNQGYAKGGVMATGGGVDDESPKIYVADLEAYNNGRLSGVWLDLADYNDADELMEAIQDFLKTSGGEEYAIHDVEYIPNSMYSEYMGQKDFEELYEMIDLAKQNDLPLSVVQEVISQYDSSAVDEFYGKYDDAEDFAQSLVDDLGIESFTDFQYYLYVTDTDRRLMAQEEADNYVDDIRDEDGGNRLIEEADLDVEEYEEADSERQEEMLDEAREIVYDRIYGEVFEGLSDPYYFLVEERGMYSLEDFANSNLVRIDFEKLADALEQDYTFIYDGGSLYVFNIR